ncbi:PA2779 family protein [Rheinheimera baltica]|uniref:PA2779 family protein n=1 Tax=Rheinheimera baltica TaxID=67576 RepID=A0ABT9HW46_9GAMM|nr:PA2779 family protein [Rheinheimera baltica]MDP5135352.1 PA2779 family protein [Rheinheimera baltica]MDP5142631.1 PA2779 family protein [Rheinheimera baltica]MDP5151929.1 PA2779 family protein [Rheinheimera baltica]MDP5188472.1 PA2779 family protein [Rheinheimera baltica]
MNKTSIVLSAFVALLLSLGQASAGVLSSDQVVAQQQQHYSQQQVLAFVDSAEVQQKLIELGVSPENAKQRIASMTTAELDALNNQLNDMPAGGIVGTIITVLVVVAVLDLMGITDVYPFIRPI